MKTIPRVFQKIQIQSSVNGYDASGARRVMNFFSKNNFL